MSPAPIRLTLLPDLPNADGEPRAGLVLPLPPNSTSRRAALAIFPSVTAALMEKVRLEGGAA
ncbi:MAG TPA: hypothetical protein VIL69_13765 [Roseomonas sp.]|jgi:hypothetical protein